MADENNELIQYSFEGDYSGLKQAVNGAIASLDSYDASLNIVNNTINNINQTMNSFFIAFQLLLRYVQQATSYQETANNAWKAGSTYSTEYANALRSAAQAQSQWTSSSEQVTRASEEQSDQNNRNHLTWSELIRVFSDAQKSLNELKPNIKGVSVSFGELTSVVSSVCSALKTYLGIDVVGTLQQSIEASTDYIENLNLFTVVMGDAIEQGTKFVNLMEEMYGLDPSNIMAYTSSFNALAMAADAPAEAAANMSTGLMSLATDVASLYNIDVDTAANRLRSSMLGMQRSASQLGADIRTSTLQIYAQKIGLEGQVKTMSEANREGLRYLALVDELSFAQGDWAKTIENPTNQLRILKEQIRILSREIGNTFLNSLRAILPYINGFVMALSEAVHFIAVLLGFQTEEAMGSVSNTQDLADAVGNVGDEAESSAKKLKKLIAPFDELNVLQDTSNSDEGATSDVTSDTMDPKLVAAIEALTTPLSEVEMQAHKVRDAILDFLGLNSKDDKLTPILTNIKGIIDGIINICKTLKTKIKEALTINSNGEKILATIKGILQDIYDWAILIIQDTQDWAEDLDLEPITTAFSDLLEAIRNLAQIVGKDLEEAYRNVLLPLSKWTIEEAVPWILERITNALNWFVEHPEVAVIIGSIVAAITVVAGVITVISSILITIKGFLDSIAVVTSVIGVIFGVSGGAALGILIAIVAAIALVIAAIILVITHLDEIKAWIDDHKEEIKTFLDAVREKLSFIFDPFLDKVQEVKDKFKEIKDTISDNIQKIKDKAEEIKTALTGVFLVISYLFNKYIVTPIKKWYYEEVKPIVDALKELFGPVFEGLGDAFFSVWDKVVDDVLNLFIWLINNAIGFLEHSLNNVIDIVNLLVAAANLVPGVDINYVSRIQLDRIDYLASGGVVTGPTQAIIGEGKFSEAVIPLGNSPQLNDMLDKFADKVNNRPVEVKVLIGEKDWDAFVYQSSQRGQYIVGNQQVEGNVYG